MVRNFFRGASPVMLLGSAIVLSVCIAVTSSILASSWGLALGVLLMLVCGADLRRLPRRLMLVNLFIIFVWLVVPFSLPGDSVWSWGWLSLSRQGLELCLLVTIKANAIFFVFYALVARLTPDMLGCAMGGLGMPEKLVHLFLLAFRFWHLLAYEWQGLRTAARLRAFRPASNRHSYYTLAAMLALLLLRANWRGRRVYEAMLLRGFSGTFHHCGRSRPGSADLPFALAMGAALSVLGGLSWCG